MQCKSRNRQALSRIRWVRGGRQAYLHAHRTHESKAMKIVGVTGRRGGVIASLLSEENRWIIAQNIEVAGGYII